MALKQTSGNFVDAMFDREPVELFRENGNDVCMFRGKYNTLKFLEEIGETKQERVAEIRARRGRRRVFSHLC